nr:hypothetical protein [candidate division Zixibacteria bacterium]
MKTGITSETPIQKRYSLDYLKDKQMITLKSGSRKEMAKLEREVVENNPGPLNKEKWAGKNKE